MRSKRHSRAARRQQVEHLRLTIDGLAGSHQRAVARAGEAKRHWMATQSALHTARNELERERDTNGALIESARQLVGMVSKYCIANAAPIRAEEHIRPDARSFQQTVPGRMPAYSGGLDVPLTVRSMRETMHILHADSTVRSHVDRSLHVRVQLADSNVAYGISEYALMDGDFDAVAARVAEAMAPALLREIRQFAGNRFSGRSAFSAPVAGRRALY